MTDILKRWAVATLVLLTLGLGYSTYRGIQQRAVLQERLKENGKHIATLESELKVERATFKADTIKLFRRITRTDTLLNEIVRSDTLKLTDTVKVTVEVVREAVATLNACRETVLTCGLLRAKEQARGDSLNARVNLLLKARPSTIGNIARTALWVAAGFGVGKIIR